MAGSEIVRRVARVDWSAVEARLDTQGYSRLGRLLTAAECRALVRDYDRDELYRSTVEMERHRFGRGQYRYFAHPVPPRVAELRQELYGRLSPTANRWWSRLGRGAPFPAGLDDFVNRCRAAGQTRPTPLVLRYGAGDYNCLHQDLYGAIAFPLQVLVVLSQRERDYEGGEVILVEQRPRAQSKAVALALERGEALVFANRERPARGSRGFYKVQMRHGASPIASGQRFVLGIIFHDAR